MNGQNFVAIDVETANEDLSSICQVGIAGFCDGQLVSTWESLVNPLDDFSPINTWIHKIDADSVKDSPTWPDLIEKINSRLSGQIVVCHTPFDRLALSRASERFGCGCSGWTWLDSAKVVRRAWPQFSQSGYGLRSVAASLGIRYRAHDALEDAKCAGTIVLRAINETGIEIDQWLVRVMQPIDANGHSSIHRDGTPDRELSGEVLVFTGALSMTRHQAADAAAILGCQVDDGVTKHTTILVVGDQDLGKLAGKDKSSKRLKAERLISKGQLIRIVGESDFMRITHQQCVQVS